MIGARRWMMRAVCAALVLAPACLFAQVTPAFSADLSIKGEDAKGSGKLYFSPPRIRMEMPSIKGPRNTGLPGDMNIIIDGDRQTSYVLLPHESKYMEFHGDSADNIITGLPGLRQLRGKASADPCMGRTGATCKKLDAETVNGRTCEKWEVNDKDSGKFTVWIDQKLQFPIKVHKADGGELEFSNIQEGPQDPSLFTVPAGYKPFIFR
jgi:hypothetical protein